MNQGPLSLGAILYPGFEMLDLFGPLEMFSLLGQEKMVIHMIAEAPGPIPAALSADITNGPTVNAEFGFDDAPELDLLLLPGGFGTLPELDNQALLDFLRDRSAQAQITASVCSGSAILARAGLLDGLRATSNKQLFALATQQSDQVHWVEQARWVDAGHMVTASGVSAGMDMSLALIERLFDTATAEAIASTAEYSWHRDPEQDPFAEDLNKAAELLGLI